MNTKAKNIAIIYSGHMIDAPKRHPARFPYAVRYQALEIIQEQVLEYLGELRRKDIVTGYGQLAAGADLLFAGTLMDAGCDVHAILPQEPAKFLLESVLPSVLGDLEARDYLEITANDRVTWEVVERHKGDIYSATNEQIVDAAFGEGPLGEDQEVHAFVLWDGKGSDGPGGTKHMVETIRSRGGCVTWIKIEDGEKFSIEHLGSTKPDGWDSI